MKAAGERAEYGPESERLEAAMAVECGIANAAAGRLVAVIAELLAGGFWQIAGIHLPEQWVAWKCGVSPQRARTLVTMARRLGELPATRTALEAGELSEDQVAVICRHAPATVDDEVAELARHSTVTQLRRVLGRYVFDTPEAGEEQPEAEPSPAPAAEESRRVDFGHTETGEWRMTAVLPPDEGAVVERALEATRDELFRAGDHGPEASPAEKVSWADTLVAMADKALGADAVARPHRDRHLVLLHVRAGGGAHLHLGPGLSEGLARYLACDARVRSVVEAEGKAVSVGRAFRIVPEAHPHRRRGPRRRVPGPGLRPQPLAARAPHRALGERRSHRHTEPAEPVPGAPSSAPSGRPGHRGRRRRARRRGVHRRARPAPGRLRPTGPTWPPTAAARELGGSVGRTPRPVGDPVQRTGFRVSIRRGINEPRSAEQFPSGWRRTSGVRRGR